LLKDEEGGGEGDEDGEDGEDAEEASDVTETVDLGGDTCILGVSPSSLASSSSTFILPFPRCSGSTSFVASFATVVLSDLACGPTRGLLVPPSLPYSSPSSILEKLLLSSKFRLGDRVALGAELAPDCAYDGGYGTGEGDRDDKADMEGVGDEDRELGSGTARGSNPCFGEDEEKDLDDDDGDLGEASLDGDAWGPSLSLTRFTLYFWSCFDGGGEGNDAASVEVGAGASSTHGNPVCGPLRLRMEEKCSQSWYATYIVLCSNESSS
jgi:hypothetical protein